ncbi:hypothetical protein [Dyella jiangningensis]|uniref:DUF3619 domain-containing protein n=1 Tax=Dyella jiangningensis TaxID=1379159 RepID=A0A328P6S7_9GAMM|nr:hypothetical protein [Dyella jiangningensis]RAO77310.1 hypothetical protein CA260_05340 [Dyella jiangningensis]
MNAPDNHLERRARELYREAARQLDPATAAGLRAARRAALSGADGSSLAQRLLQLLLPAGAFAAIAFAALMLSSPVQGPTGSAAGPSPVSEADGELPPDAAAADPALYQNLDFYGWLAKNGDSQASR